MRPPEAYARLQALHRPVLTNGEIAAAWGASESATTHALIRLEQDRLVRRLRHGVWAVPKEWGGTVDPLDALPVLTRPYPSYASMWTVLAAHGMIEQIPRSFFAVSLDRARHIPTTIGEFRVHAIHPALFGGMTDATGSLAGTAVPEKALFDTVYILAAHRAGHVSLPELTLTDGFDRSVLWEWVERIPTPRLRTITTRELERALASAEMRADR